MGCPHVFNDDGVCIKCKHVASYKKIDIVKVLKENVALRKMLEDICECQGNLDELIDKARKLLQMP